MKQHKSLTGVFLLCIYYIVLLQLYSKTNKISFFINWTRYFEIDISDISIEKMLSAQNDNRCIVNDSLVTCDINVNEKKCLKMKLQCLLLFFYYYYANRKQKRDFFESFLISHFLFRVFELALFFCKKIS